MKRAMLISLAVVIGLFLTGAAYAMWGGGMGYGTGANVENVKKFQKETLTLRDDLMTKQLELQNEYNKPQPDYSRIATIKKELVDIQTKIQTIADKYGLHAGGPMGQGMMSRGMMGRGMMMGGGMTGCPCPMCQ